MSSLQFLSRIVFLAGSSFLLKSVASVAVCMVVSAGGALQRMERGAFGVYPGAELFIRGGAESGVLLILTVTLNVGP